MGEPIIAVNENLDDSVEHGATYLGNPRQLYNQGAARNIVIHSPYNRKSKTAFYNTNSNGVMQHIMGHLRYASYYRHGGRIYIGGVQYYNPHYGDINQFKLRNLGVPPFMPRYCFTYEEIVLDWIIALDLDGTKIDFDTSGNIIWLNGTWLHQNPIDLNDQQLYITQRGVHHPMAPHPYRALL